VDKSDGEFVDDFVVSVLPFCEGLVNRERLWCFMAGVGLGESLFYAVFLHPFE